MADHNADEQLIPGHLSVFKKENGLWCTMVIAKDNTGHGPHRDGMFNSTHTEEEAAKMWDDVTELINSETPSESLNLTEGLKLPVLQQQVLVQTWILQNVEEKLAALLVLPEKNSDKRKPLCATTKCKSLCDYEMKDNKDGDGERMDQEIMNERNTN